MIALEYENKKNPLYKQLYTGLRLDIESGTLIEGAKLPSKRRLALDLGISINTVDSAYSQLCDEGYITVRPQSGFYVCSIGKIALTDAYKNENSREQSRSFLYDFSPSGIDSRRFPYHIWKKLLRQCFDDSDPDLFKAPEPQGLYALRLQISHYLIRSRGIDARAENIIIGSGTGSLLSTISTLLDPNIVLAAENPLYSQAYRIFKSMGHKTTYVNIDSQGVSAQDLIKSKATAVYVTPSHQFPLGFSMPAPRRIELLNWAAGEEGRYIIEDDYDSEFRYSSRPLPPIAASDKNGRVIYMGTFSKSVSPSLKISYTLLPQQLMDNFTKNRHLFSASPSRLEQKVLSEFIAQGHFERHIGKMRSVYGKKRELLVKALSCFGDNIEILGENAGHHLLVDLKSIGCQQAVELSAPQGVKVYPVSSYFIGDVWEKYRSCVLLGYGGLDEDQIKAGVLQLKKAWKALL